MIVILKAWLYQKNIKTNEHILVIKAGKYFDIWSIDTSAKTSKRHWSLCNDWTLRGMKPLMLGAYKQLDLGSLDGFLLTATIGALSKQLIR